MGEGRKGTKHDGEDVTEKGVLELETGRVCLTVFALWREAPNASFLRRVQLASGRACLLSKTPPWTLRPLTMAAPLWSQALGVGIFAAARSCRSSADALRLHGTSLCVGGGDPSPQWVVMCMLMHTFAALRAARLSPFRFASTATHRKRDSLSPREHPHDASYGSPLTGIPPEGETLPSPNADQPKFTTLKDSLHPHTLSALTADPFKLVHMSSVQAAVLPLLPNLVRRHDPDEKDAAPRDLMVKARTGTGKTLAFLVPAVEARLNALEAHAKQVATDTMKDSKPLIARAVDQYAKTHVGALIISPTRELATQIANEAMKLTRHHDRFEVKLFTGGLSRERQKRSWDMGRRDIVVATPGRLRDFIENEPGFSEALRTTEMVRVEVDDCIQRSSRACQVYPGRG